MSRTHTSIYSLYNVSRRRTAPIEASELCARLKFFALPPSLSPPFVMNSAAAPESGVRGGERTKEEAGIALA